MGNWIELDIEILRENIRSLRSSLESDTEIMFVVKSNAYGHGMEPVAKYAWEMGVKWFVVSHMQEALSLREILPKSEILLVGVLQPEDAVDAVKHNIVSIITSEKHALSLLEKIENKVRKPLRCHAKIDTGMSRLGFAWDNAAACLASLVDDENISLEGICSHLAASDDVNTTLSTEQIRRFKETISQCEEKVLNVKMRHISNSGGILNYPEADMQGVRPGIMLYGYPPKQHSGRRTDIKVVPFLSWKTQVLQVKRLSRGSPVSYNGTYVTDRKTHIGIIDIGYADGYSRIIGNRGYVIAGGRRCPVIGRVTMNMTIIDLGPSTEVREGDEVVLIGQQGDESVWADQLAEWCETIPYEIFTRIRATDTYLLRTKKI